MSESRSSGEWKLPEELRQLADAGDAAIVVEVLTVFQTDTATRLSTLRSAIAESNLPLIKNQAHSIKGSSSQIGAMGMAALCLRMEQEAMQGQTSSLAALMTELEAGFAEVCRAITADMASLQ